MNPPDKPTGTEPGRSQEAPELPPPLGGHPAVPPRSRPGPVTPDKEGGAPVDELDLDGDGSRRQ